MAFTTAQGRTSTSLSEINVTPLVDVMLVLLIIFMVTAPMLQTGIDVELPETKYVKDVNPEETDYHFHQSRRTRLLRLGRH